MSGCSSLRQTPSDRPKTSLTPMLPRPSCPPESVIAGMARMAPPSSALPRRPDTCNLGLGAC
eukprot:scaffold10698_cov112-Isochrysis_galbana.AAC.2